MELVSQNKNVSLNEILNTPGLVFGGIDYSLGKMVGHDFNDPNNIVHHVIGAWNQLFYSEPHKYNVFKALGVSSGTIDLEIVANNNLAIDPAEIRSKRNQLLKRADLEALAKSYSFENDNGYAIVFIHEFYNKPFQNAGYWLIAVRKRDQEVVFAKPIQVACKGGFGFKNYWATTILHVLTTIEKRRKSWKKR
jgi:hypothetical protein